MKKLSALPCFIVISMLLISLDIRAGLIINGSFEENAIPYGSWRWFNSNDVNGWNGSNIEIWNHLGGEEAFEGNQFAELNAHPRPSNAFSIYQDFPTIVGQYYDLSFAYQARRRGANEAFLAEVFALDVAFLSPRLSILLDDHVTGSWSVFDASFLATSDTSRLIFTSITPSISTQGNFLDDIKVTSRVPEPSSLVVLCIGIVFLIVNKKVVINES